VAHLTDSHLLKDSFLCIVVECDCSHLNCTCETKVLEADPVIFLTNILNQSMQVLK
jgi:hypothetical protein